MKKRYYFMNKPEVIEVDSNNKPIYPIFYYSKSYHLKPIHSPYSIPSNNITKRKFSLRKIYFFNVLLLAISFIIYIKYSSLKEDKSIKKSLLFNTEDKNYKIIYNNKLKYIFNKIDKEKETKFILSLKNIHHDAIKIDKNIPVRYIIYTNTKEIQDKVKNIPLKNILKPYDQIDLISLKISHKKIKKDFIQKIAITINNNFTLYLNTK